MVSNFFQECHRGALAKLHCNVHKASRPVGGRESELWNVLNLITETRSRQAALVSVCKYLYFIRMYGTVDSPGQFSIKLMTVSQYSPHPLSPPSEKPGPPPPPPLADKLRVKTLVPMLVSYKTARLLLDRATSFSCPKSQLSYRRYLSPYQQYPLPQIDYNNEVIVFWGVNAPPRQFR